MTSNQAYCIIKMYTNIIYYNISNTSVFLLIVLILFASFFASLYWNVCADFNMCLNDQKYFSHKIIQKNKVYEAFFYIDLFKLYTKKRIDDYFRLYSSSFLLFDEIISTHLENQWIFVLCPHPKKNNNKKSLLEFNVRLGWCEFITV